MSDEPREMDGPAGPVQRADAARADASFTLEITRVDDDHERIANTDTAVVRGGDALASGAGQRPEFQRFEIVGEIGVGGMGVVHKVYDKIMFRQVAMKVMHSHLVENPDHRRRFLQEAHITGQLDHPNIVPVYDLGAIDQDRAFIIMKLIDGETLSRLLQPSRDQQLIGPPLEEFLQIFLKICDAIDFAHSRGIIHRDLKPSNIMVGAHGEAYVMDWGIAMILDAAAKKAAQTPLVSSPATRQMDSAGSLMGTAAYMAPEQAYSRIEDIDVRTDVFGLGGILYEILTGQPPHPGDKPEIQLQMARAGEVMPPEQAAPRRRLPPGLCQIAMRALARNRQDRHPDVRSLKEDVRAFLRGGGWFHTLRFEPGTVIVKEGDAAESAYIINEGYCEVYKGTTGGARKVLRRLGPGEVFGETGILTNKPRTASVRALDHVTATVITGETLGYEIAEKGWLSVFVKALAERFREHDRELTIMREG